MILKQLTVNKWVGLNNKKRITIYENYNRITKEFEYSYILSESGKGVRKGKTKTLTEATNLIA